MLIDIPKNLLTVESRIAAACNAAQRPRHSVQLLAVSKTQSVQAVAQLASCGQVAFGENYVQEALPKLAALSQLQLEWHFIGPIQSNKTADIAAHFDWAHGVDRLKIAERLSAQRPAHLPALNICVQVNVSGEVSKSGCRPEDVSALCSRLIGLPGLRLRGLMALPAPAAQQANVRASFHILRQLFERQAATTPHWDTLSMGMSDDLEEAIAEGSTLIRIGSALFGQRIAGNSAPETAS